MYCRDKKRHSEWQKEYFSKPEIRKKRREIARVYQNRPEVRLKNNVGKWVRRRVKNGTMLRMPCVKCGDPKTEAHHQDYSKPLDVIWLCRKHHTEQHPRPKVKSVKLT